MAVFVKETLAGMNRSEHCINYKHLAEFTVIVIHYSNLKILKECDSWLDATAKKYLAQSDCWALKAFIMEDVAATVCQVYSTFYKNLDRTAFIAMEILNGVDLDLSDLSVRSTLLMHLESAYWTMKDFIESEVAISVCQVSTTPFKDLIQLATWAVVIHDDLRADVLDDEDLS